MGASLYTVLGVGRDADSDAIERAYRDRAKTHHPDVSDDPDAGERFKRLTFARDTLTDEDERARYDRMGHESYVGEYAPPGLFEVERADEGPPARERETRDGERTTTTPTGERTTTTATDGGVSAASRSTRNTASTEDFYSRDRVARDRAGTVGPVRRVWNGARALGGWLVVHLLLLASALAVGWVALVTSAAANLALPGLACLFGLSATALLASALHVVTVLYT